MKFRCFARCTNIDKHGGFYNPLHNDSYEYMYAFSNNIDSNDDNDVIVRHIRRNRWRRMLRLIVHNYKINK